MSSEEILDNKKLLGVSQFGVEFCFFFYNLVYFHSTVISLSVSGSQDFKNFFGTGYGSEGFETVAKNQHEEKHEFAHLRVVLSWHFLAYNCREAVVG